MEEVVPDATSAFTVDIAPDVTTSYGSHRATCTGSRQGLGRPDRRCAAGAGVVRGGQPPLEARRWLQLQNGAVWTAVATGTADAAGTFSLRLRRPPRRALPRRSAGPGSRPASPAAAHSVGRLVVIAAAVALLAPCRQPRSTATGPWPRSGGISPPTGPELLADAARAHPGEGRVIDSGIDYGHVSSGRIVAGRASLPARRKHDADGHGTFGPAGRRRPFAWRALRACLQR